MIKGTDQSIKITIKDATGTNIDIDNLTGLIVAVYQKGFTIDQFSLISQPGFQTINVLNAANGEIEIYVNKDKTKNSQVGKDIFLEIKTRAVDVNFAGGDVEKSTGEIKIDTMFDSELKYTSFE